MTFYGFMLKKINKQPDYCFRRRVTIRHGVKQAKNLEIRRENWKILNVSRKKNLSVKTFLATRVKVSRPLFKTFQSVFCLFIVSYIILKVILFSTPEWS